MESVTTVIHKLLVGKRWSHAFKLLNKVTVLLFGCRVMLRISGKFAGGVMGGRSFLGIWMGSQTSSVEHSAAREQNGVVVRTRAGKELRTGTRLDVINKVTIRAIRVKD